MDYIGKKYKDAQLIAEKIIMLKKGNCLDQVGSSNLRLDCNSYVPIITKWFRLDGFRMNSDKASTMNHIRNAVSGWIRGTTGTGSDAAYAILRQNSYTSVFYGSNCNETDAIFRSNVSECSIQSADFSNLTFEVNGLFTGTLSSLGTADALISSSVQDFYVECVFTPVADSDVCKIIENNKKYVNILDDYKSFQRNYGNLSKRTETIPVASVIQAVDVLKEEIEYLECNMGRGFVRAMVRYGTKTERDFNTISSIINSGFTHENGKGVEPVRMFRLEGKCSNMKDYLMVPYARINNADFVGNVHSLSLQHNDCITSFCTPSLLSCDGYYVKNYSVDEDSVEDFTVPESIKGESIRIGNIFNSQEYVMIPISEMIKHSFITGSTGTGKTTTVKAILCELYEKGIPFTVIEAAKKEYFTLFEKIPELQVYTPGTDGRALLINPLQPEDGVLIENHVSAVVRALLASTGGEHPIPEAFNGLLKQTYNEFGWEYGMLAYTDEYKPFPTFADVLKNVDRYIENHAKYGAEVRQNLTAALNIRTETMNDGALGHLFSDSFGLMSEDLLGKPCIIELSDFSEESVTFLMNILLFRFQCYLSKKTESSELRRVIVVEEAHNVFKKTISEDNGRALSNNYFDKMLAEIRSSGTGLLISDQRPSILSEAIMENTAIKIVHGLDTDNRDYVGHAINMSDFQIKKIGEFNHGECLVSIRGKYGVQHAQIKQIKGTEGKINPACHICASRFRCKSAAVTQMIESMDEKLIDFHVKRIMSNPYNPGILERNITDMLKGLNVMASDGTKICFVGNIIQRYSNSSVQEKRIITNTYYRYLKGGVHNGRN